MSVVLQEFPTGKYYQGEPLPANILAFFADVKEAMKRHDITDCYAYADGWEVENDYLAVEYGGKTYELDGFDDTHERPFFVRNDAPKKPPTPGQIAAGIEHVEDISRAMLALQPSPTPLLRQL